MLGQVNPVHNLTSHPIWYLSECYPTTYAHLRSLMRRITVQVRGPE